MLEHYLAHLSRHYFLNLITFCFSIACLIVSIRNKNQHKDLGLIRVYAISYAFFHLIVIAHCLLPVGNDHLLYARISIIYDEIFTVIEFLIFSKLIYNQLAVRRLKYLHLSILVIVTIMLLYLVAEELVDQTLIPDRVHNAFLIQALGLCVVCVLFFIDYYLKDPRTYNFKHPIFWIITGVSFTMFTSIPFSVTMNFIQKNNLELYEKLFSIFYILYVILFVLIIKAYRCSPSAN
jgi:hypothetical protein